MGADSFNKFCYGFALALSNKIPDPEIKENVAMNTGKVISILDATPTYCIAKCEICGGELDIRVKPVYQWTEGWVDPTGGMSLPVRYNRYAHCSCVERNVRSEPTS
jgi:hypothetical protein